MKFGNEALCLLLTPIKIYFYLNEKFCEYVLFSEQQLKILLEELNFSKPIIIFFEEHIKYYKPFKFDEYIKIYK